jgi:hypothetical protein
MARGAFLILEVVGLGAGAFLACLLRARPVRPDMLVIIGHHYKGNPLKGTTIIEVGK